MNQLTTDLKILHEATLNNLKSSKAINTLRAYKSDFKDFGSFCEKHGFKSLPSEPKIVSLYLTHLSKNSKISTLKRRLVSLSVVHKLKGHYLDTKHPIIVENLMGIKRLKGSIQKGKKPILISHLKSIINVINEQKNQEIKNYRDKAIILIGFGGGFRRTELISIDKEDLEFVRTALAALPEAPFNKDTWKTWTTKVTDKTGRKGKNLFLPLRKALTGNSEGPDMGKLLPFLGKIPKI